MGLATLGISFLLFAGAETARVVLRVGDVIAPAPRAFSVGVPFRQGLVEESAAFFLVRPDGGREALRQEILSRWPDGTAHWVRFEGIARQEKLILVCVDAPRAALPWFPVHRIEGGRQTLETRALRFEALEEGTSLLSLAHEEASLRVDLLVGSGSSPLSGTGSKRSVFLERSEVFPRALRVQGKIDAPGVPGRTLDFDLRAEPTLDAAQFQLEAMLWNPSHEPVELEGITMALRVDGLAPRAFWSLGERISRQEKPKSPLRVSSPVPERLSSVPERFCWEGMRSLCISAPGLTDLGPKEVVLDPCGILRFRLLAGKATIPAFTALSWTIGFRFHEPQHAAIEHRRANAWERNRANAEIVIEESRGLETSLRAGEASLDSRLDSILEEGLRRLQEEMSEHRGWRDFGDHRLRRQWSHLEFDTAAGLLRWGLRREDVQAMRIAEQALEHWKTQDRFFAPPGDPRRALPAVHGVEHASMSVPEPGHLWVEGLLLHYANSGDLSSREAALQMGDALLQQEFWGRHDGKGLERHWAWPLLALSALQEFFPLRGYERGMEEIVEEILLRQRPDSGIFLFDGRVSKDERSARVNLWLSGGLLLESLLRYRNAAGKRDLLPIMQKLARWIVREGWDRKRQRFVHTVEVDMETGDPRERWGSLRPVWELYLISQLLSIPEAESGDSWRRLLRRRATRLLEDFRWPKAEVGNDLSLLLRAELGLRRAF